MNVSPMTRYYLCHLLAERGDIDDLLRNTPASVHRASMSGESLTVNRFLEHLIHLIHLSDLQTGELELLVNLHQKIKDRQSTKPEHLHELETKLFALLGLSEAPMDSPEEEFTNFFEPDMAIAPHQTYAYKPTAMPTLDEYLEYFQKAGQIAQTYLGKMLVSNYWLVTRPSHHWLQSFNVVAVSPEVNQVTSQQTWTQQHLTIEEKSLLESWLADFVARCSRILPPLPRLLKAEGIPEGVLMPHGYQ
ncbi:hypothetical protein L3556_09000 [Candidatus Synechococcus calcipolaris G9]|uniref:Uncharacterized protein n=1 Tax=Candidatus Synechococcus calcipolaris G9 TaxID=1497997 RepID=A0ABT6EZM7_9SYNE|nr:hypothetical protein [Candidatus Synechococcus calcipolaris]MDG2991060.1 hypothetical protein [Candidatus Synechococcus calcipolaris G9]